MSPLFIVIEGLDGSGGTTQSRLLCAWLQSKGYKAHLTKEPSDRPVGQFLQKALLKNTPEAQISDRVLPYLFAADRQDHIDEEILPNLKNGSFVISDRYYHSSLAYQGLSMGFSKVATLNQDFRVPDITFVLWLEPETSFSRIQNRGMPVERFETLDKLRTISEAYKSVYTYCSARGEKIIKIDARLSIEEIHRNIQEHINAHLSS